MKREIKFRAWDDGKKEWLLGYELENLGGFSIVGETMMMGEWSSVLSAMLNGHFGKSGENLKIMQFTGLKDKNGKDIYEGDITESQNFNGHNFRKDVVFWEGCFCHKWSDGRGHIFNPNHEVVIGNIYENPELIK